jgi:hypothetical protein
MACSKEKKREKIVLSLLAVYSITKRILTMTDPASGKYSTG